MLALRPNSTSCIGPKETSNLSKLRSPCSTHICSNGMHWKAWLTSTPSSNTAWIQSNSHTAPTDSQMTPRAHQEAEKISHGPSDSQKVLQLRPWDSLDWLITARQMEERIIGDKLPAIKDLFSRRCQRKAIKMFKDSSHPRHGLFSLLPHAKRYRCTKSGTNRTMNSFYPQAVRLLNNTAKWLPGQSALISHWTNYDSSHTMLLLFIIDPVA